jgi:hypothetical protein
VTNERFIELIRIVRNALNMGPDDRPTLLKRLDVLVAQERGEESGNTYPEPAPLTVDELSDEDRLGYASMKVIQSEEKANTVYLTDRETWNLVREVWNAMGRETLAEAKRQIERDNICVPRQMDQRTINELSGLLETMIQQNTNGVRGLAAVFADAAWIMFGEDRYRQNSAGKGAKG